ncbi:facilitated trehalose transporter Tret1 [Anoplophora glabripennis]|nr:facilitated trehalose transporter Tret1 [Anoplophora glabripennis]
MVVYLFILFKMEKLEKEGKEDKNDMGNWTLQYVAAASASLANFSTGIVFGWPSQISDELMQGKLDFPINSDDLGWICSSSSIGAALLALFIGSLCDKIGRKITMLLLIGVFEIGWVLIILSNSVWMLILGRFMTGMAGGSYCVTVSMYIGEIARKEVRGVLGSLVQFMISCGILFTNVAGAYLSIRSLSIACAALPILFGFAFFSMPETPFYLLRKGRIEESKESLRKFLGKHYVDTEYEDLRLHLKCDTSEKQSTVSVFKKRSVKKACVLGVGLALVKVLTGIDSVTSYLSHIFGKTDIELGAQNASIIFAVFEVFSVVPQALLVDRLGRKVLLVVTQIVMGLCLGVTALSIAIESENAVVQYIPVVALCLFVVGFSVGIGPIGWIITAEIFEEKIKGRAMSVCTFLIWILAFVSVKLFVVFEDLWNISVPLYVYSVISLAGAFFILFYVPETKNK